MAHCGRWCRICRVGCGRRIRSHGNLLRRWPEEPELHVQHETIHSAIRAEVKGDRSARTATSRWDGLTRMRKSQRCLCIQQLKHKLGTLSSYSVVVSFVLVAHREHNDEFR